MSRSSAAVRASAPEFVPILTAGRHRNARRGACFMEFASFLAGERWSDHPACTHRIVAALARDVNDLSSDRARDELMPLVTRVIGIHDVDELRVAMLAATAAMPVASLDRQRALGVGILLLVSAGASQADADRVFSFAPDTERWARSYLARTPRHSFGARTCEAIVHTSVVGIALACVDDADARLRALLETVLDEVAPTTSPAALPALALA
jgi:hypothetical protein